MKRAPGVAFSPLHPERAFGPCRNVIASGGVIAYPTDTFYGLGVDPRNREAVRKLFRIKEREEHQPILLLIADAGDVPAWAEDPSVAASEIMRRFWPGPLTLVFKAKAGVLPELTGGTGTIGLRVPADERVRSLIRSLGNALTGTSANRAGQPSPRTALEAEAAIGDRIDLILDGGETPGGMPSTVVDVSGNEPRIVREGAVRSRDILNDI